MGDSDARNSSELCKTKILLFSEMVNLRGMSIIFNRASVWPQRLNDCAHVLHSFILNPMPYLFLALRAGFDPDRTTLQCY